MLNHFAILLVVLGGAVLTAACGSAAAAPEVNVEVTAADFKYSPGTIVVRAGQKVHLTLKNEGKVAHELLFTGFEAGTKADPGESNGANFTAPQPGTYTFLCTMPGHKEAGMVGRMVVQ